jgi:CelD/BcsL family acetyltransferase involved in cellulose biosynthesis
MSGLSATVVPFEQARHGREWQPWHDLARSGPPFLAPEFFALGRGLSHADQALVAEAWRDDQLAGALPLELDGRTLTAMRSDQSPGFDYLGDAGGLTAIWRTLRRDRRWDVMILKNVPSTSPLVTRLPELARESGCRTVQRPGARHLYFDLRQFEAALSPKFLTNLRRCARKAGGVELERITHPTRADWADAFAIEAKGWKGVAGTDIGSDPSVAHLYCSVARFFGRRDQAALHFLRADGRRIAMLLAVEDSHTLYALKMGYDPERSAVSPGQLVVWEVARDAEARGLRRFDFVGKDEAWKRKWTELASEQVSILIYRSSPRGLALYALRELVKPRLPEPLQDFQSPLRHGCQRGDVIGRHSTVAAVVGRLDRGLGIKSGIRRRLRSPEPPREPLGAASQFPVGSWVRVRDQAAVRATLDARSRNKGLEFVPAQWRTCGEVHRVVGHVRRIRDDHGRMRPVSGTVLLEAVTCAGRDAEPAGCGRHCPLMYRDAWLEPASAPVRAPPPAFAGVHARVREIEEIRAGLDLRGRRDGVTFMPEMAELCGRRFRVAARLGQVFEYDRWVEPRAACYLLEGAQCTGKAAGDTGPCDRACTLVWHRDWLLLDPENGALDAPDARHRAQR